MESGPVFVIEGDPEVGALVGEILAEEGLVVTLIHRASPEALHEVVARPASGCVLLGGAGTGGCRRAWQTAAWLRARLPLLRLVLVSTDLRVTREARLGQSVRSQLASFTAVIDQPFDVDDLVAAVTGVRVPFGTNVRRSDRARVRPGWRVTC